jgi:glucosylceramidase
MTLQNEPNAVQTWDSCTYTGEEEKEFLRDYMYPALERNSLTEVEIFIWDHNKERVFERACEVIDKDTDKMITGLAFHWYSGDHFEALKLIKEKFPNKKLILSETCIEYSKFDKDDYLANAQKYAHDIIGNINNGMSEFYDWNILLDEKGGPNHVGNYCDAPFLYDTLNHLLIERNTLSYISHFSHFITPGAKRIAYTKYTDQLEVTALKNPDGKLVIVLLNRSEEKIPVVIRLKGEYLSMEIERQSISTGIIDFK